MKDQIPEKKILKKEDIINAHDVRTKIAIENLGEFTISQCSIRDVTDAFKNYSEDSKNFTLFLFSKTIQEPKLEIKQLQEFEDKQLLELGQKWLEFNDYYLEDFKQIDKNNKTKSLSFYEKFRLAIEAPQKRAVETFKPLIDRITKSNADMLKSLANFSIPKISIPLDNYQKLNLGKIIGEDVIKRLDTLNLKNITTKPSLMGMLKSYQELNQVHKEIPKENLFLENIQTQAPTPQFELVRAVNKIENSVVDSLDANQKLSERIADALEDQNLQAQENLRLQKQIRNLTIWLVVLTIIIIFLTAYLIIKKP